MSRPDRPLLASLSAFLEKLRVDQSVASVHKAVQKAQSSGLTHGQMPVRTQAKHFSRQWTDMRLGRRVPPYKSMILPVVVLLAGATRRDEDIAEAQRLWNAARAEASASGGAEPDLGDEAPVVNPVPPRLHSVWIGAGVMAIAVGMLGVNAGLDRRDGPGWTLAAVGALVASVGADLIRRAIRRRRGG